MRPIWPGGEGDGWDITLTRLRKSTSCSGLRVPRGRELRILTTGADDELDGACYRPGPQRRRRCPLPQAGPQPRQGQAQVALGNTQLRVYHKLLSNPGMHYQDLGPDHYERQAALRRKIAYHVREIQAPGLDVTLTRPAPNPDRTDQQPPRPSDRSACLTRRHKPPPGAAARPAEVLFSG